MTSTPDSPGGYGPALEGDDPDDVDGMQNPGTERDDHDFDDEDRQFDEEQRG
jgi:hypothetical protein